MGGIDRNFTLFIPSATSRYEIQQQKSSLNYIFGILTTQTQQNRKLMHIFLNTLNMISCMYMDSVVLEIIIEGGD